MGKKTKPPKPPKAPEIDGFGPTPEQQADGAFAIEDITDKRNGGGTISIGKAWRRRPMIAVLAAAGAISDEEYRALRHYRHHADLADRSPVRDSLCLQRGGAGAGMTLATLNAIRVRDDLERAAGSLVDILRAVVVNDVSLSQWAMNAAGSIERQVERKGKPVMLLEPRRKALEIAKLEIRIAAQRVEAELAA